MLLLDVYLLRQSPYRYACEGPRASLWVTGFLLSIGVLYGLLVALYQRAVGGELQGVPVADIPLGLLFGGNVVSGMAIAVIAHGGITLIAWLMARAVGGSGRPADLYRATAYLLPLSIPALPQLALGTAAPGLEAPAVPLAFLYAPLAWVAAFLLLAGMFQLLRATQNTSPARSATAVALFALFCYSVLIL